MLIMVLRRHEDACYKKMQENKGDNFGIIDNSEQKSSANIIHKTP